MSNPRITPKERGLLKGAVRRVFSRSDLRKQAIDAVRIDHFDPTRPRVKKWGLCRLCNLKVALYQMQVDHLLPIIPINSSLERMSWDEVVNNTWCAVNNLQAICLPCHKNKSKIENAERRRIKKEKLKG